MVGCIFQCPAHWKVTGLDHAQQIAVSILFIAAGLWISEWVPLFIVSFIILALELVWRHPALQDAGVEVSQTLFFQPFFSDIILLFLGGFILSSLMQKYRLNEKFAHRMMLRSKGEPGRLLLIIIMICSFLSMWVSNTATAAMMLAMILPVLNRLPEDHPFQKALVLAIPFGCNIGGLGTPIGTPPNAIAIGYLLEQGITIGFVQWMVIAFPFMLIALFALWRMLLKIYPPDGLTLDLEPEESTPLSIRQKGALLIFLLTASGWFFSGPLGVTTGTIGLFPLITSFWFGFLTIADFRKLPWDVLFMVAGGLALGTAIQQSGLGTWLIAHLPADIEGWLFLIIVFSVAGLMSVLMSNTATAGLLIPLIMALQLAPQGIIQLAIAAALMCSMAMALPVSTPPNALAFSSGIIKGKDMLFTGTMISMIGFVIIITIGPVFPKIVLPLLIG